MIATNLPINMTALTKGGLDDRHGAAMQTDGCRGPGV